MGSFGGNTFLPKFLVFTLLIYFCAGAESMRFEMEDAVEEDEVELNAKTLEDNFQTGLGKMLTFFDSLTQKFLKIDQRMDKMETMVKDGLEELRTEIATVIIPRIKALERAGEERDQKLREDVVTDDPCDQLDYPTVPPPLPTPTVSQNCSLGDSLDLVEKDSEAGRAEAPYLVLSNRHELGGINLTTLEYKPLISNLSKSLALDFHYTEKGYVIFWTDTLDERIYKGNLVSGSLMDVEVIQTGVVMGEGLAVDWIGDNLYWVDSNLTQIEVAKLNGSYRKTLISGNMVKPRSIALDPRDGVLFWTDWEAASPRIEKASMSGNDREVVMLVRISGHGRWPNGLTLDYTLRRIYWADAWSDSICSIRYDGSDYLTILTQHDSLKHPFATTILDNDMFWTDWASKSVMRANKFDGSNVTMINNKMQGQSFHATMIQPFHVGPYDVKILHPSRQPRTDIKNPCADNNGNCSHLCLLNFNKTRSCACPRSMILGGDTETCIGEV